MSLIVLACGLVVMSGLQGTATAAELGSPVRTVSTTLPCSGPTRVDSGTFDSGHAGGPLRVTVNSGVTSRWGGPGDVRWQYAFPVTAGSSDSIQTGCGSGETSVSVTVDWFVTPSAPTTFSGVQSPAVGIEFLSIFPVNIPAEAQYSLELTLSQGAVRISRASTTFCPVSLIAETPTSRVLDLGTLSTGVHYLCVEAVDGPPAIWSARIVQRPVQIAAVNASPAAVAPGAITRISYTASGDTTITASVVRDGLLYRSLGTFPASGSQELIWDGLFAAGTPVPDGVYTARIESRDFAGNYVVAETAVTVDGTPPVITLNSPKSLPASSGVAISVADAGSGVSEFFADVDGDEVWGFQSLPSTLTYKPRNGWRPGSKHTIDAVATDGAGNRTTWSAEFTVMAAGSSSTMRTLFKKYAPFQTRRGKVKLKRGLKVRQRSGWCWMGAVKSNRSNAWRCFRGNRIHDPCFAPRGLKSGYVVCPVTPWKSKVTRLKLTKKLPGKFRNRPGRRPLSVWALELADGARCTFLGGATTTIGDQRLNYGCNRGGSLVGSIEKERGTRRYMILRVPPDIDVLEATVDELESVIVKRAWR